MLPAKSDETTPEQDPLPPVTVTATRLLTPISEVGSSVTVNGDTGDHAGSDGKRIRCDRDHIRVAATGSVDEANAFIGLATRHASEPVRAILLRIQNDLFNIGADLRRSERPPLKVGPLRLQETQVAWLEAHIEEPMGRLGH